MITTKLNGNASIGRTLTDQRFARLAAKTREISSAQAWFTGGERIGYDVVAGITSLRHSDPANSGKPATRSPRR